MEFLTEKEFMEKANLGAGTPQNIRHNAKRVYNYLMSYLLQDKIDEQEIQLYAKCHWCFRDPDALEMICTDRDGFIHLNNCEERITPAEAMVRINAEWGFECSQITIIGEPYYASTDWQYIRFNVKSSTWLWCNDDLFQVRI